MTIRYISPFATDKNYGGELNRVISELPDDCYIVVRDWDTLPTTPDSLYGQQIEAIITANPDYALIGCVTNRLRSPDQLYNRTFSECGDIGEHLRIGKELYDQHYSEVVPLRGIAGLFMLFHKSVWERVRFRENTHLFDKYFCSALRKRRLKIGMATGLYMFHLYRFGQSKPKEATGHLIAKKRANPREGLYSD